MWLIRGIAGLFFIFLAIISLISPIIRAAEGPAIIAMAFIAFGFAALGLWIMGGTTALWLSTLKWLPDSARKHVLDKYIQSEIQVRKSRWFGLRNRLMGSVALILGLGGLLLAYINDDWNMSWEVWTGLLLFIALGFWYLIKGRNAESRTPVGTDLPRT